MTRLDELLKLMKEAENDIYGAVEFEHQEDGTVVGTIYTNGIEIFDAKGPCTEYVCVCLIAQIKQAERASKTFTLTTPEGKSWHWNGETSEVVDYQGKCPMSVGLSPETNDFIAELVKMIVSRKESE